MCTNTGKVTIAIILKGIVWSGTKKECRNVGKVYFIVQFCSDVFFWYT